MAIVLFGLCRSKDGKSRSGRALTAGRSAALRARLATAPGTARLGCYLSVLTRCPEVPLHGTRPSMRTTVENDHPKIMVTRRAAISQGHWPAGSRLTEMSMAKAMRGKAGSRLHPQLRCPGCSRGSGSHLFLSRAL